jgi:3-isopropylmalate dehydrogenase/3-benzylmalate dehydrogenase
MNDRPTNTRPRRTVVALPGEGVGPEVVAAASRVIERVAHLQDIPLEIRTRPFGVPAFEKTGSYFPEQTQEACRSADAVLLGAVERDGLLDLRRGFDFFANLRPVLAHPQLADRSPLREDLAREIDILFVRELTSGIHYGPSGRDSDEAGAYGFHTMQYYDWQIRRVADVALDAARTRRGRVTVAHKENALPHIPWCDLVREQARSFPEVEVEFLLIDNLSTQLVLDPGRFDVVLSGNLMGDWLSSLGGALIGSIGLLPSASLNGDGFGLFEPIHGTAPEIAGRGTANPVGAILSAAMMFENWNEVAAGRCIRDAVASTLDDGVVTADLEGPNRRTTNTETMAGEICARLEKVAAP